MTNKLSPFQQILELCEISGVVLLPFSFLKKKENKQNRQLESFGRNVFKDSLTASAFFHVFCHFGREGIFKSAFQFCTYSILCIFITHQYLTYADIRMHTSMSIYRYMHIYMYMCVHICIYTYTIMLIYIHTYKHTLHLLQKSQFGHQNIH